MMRQSGVADRRDSNLRPPACEAEPPVSSSASGSIFSTTLHQFRESAFAQSRTRFGAAVWNFDTVSVQLGRFSAETTQEHWSHKPIHKTIKNARDSAFSPRYGLFTTAIANSSRHCLGKPLQT